MEPILESKEETNYKCEIIQLTLKSTWEYDVSTDLCAICKNPLTFFPQNMKTQNFREKMSQMAFAETAYYDALISNFNPYIKKKYRDITYFRGIDYHMDSIDVKGQDNHFITMYVYLNKTDEHMSPLNLIKKSHIYGHTSFPHFIKDYPNENYLEYSNDNKNFKKFER